MFKAETNEVCRESPASGDDVGGEGSARYGPAADDDVLKIEMPCMDSARQP